MRTVLLVDDHPIVREGYRTLLSRRRDPCAVVEAGSAAEAYRAYRAHAPDIVLMDVALAGPSGIEATRHIRQWDRSARILMVSMHLNATIAAQAFQAGAMGYVTKSSPPPVLLRAVDEILAGRKAMSDDIAQELALDRLGGNDDLAGQLSPREFEVFVLLTGGSPETEIADALAIELKTVRNIHYAIKSKLGARTDFDLTLRAIRAGVLVIP